MTAAGWIAGAGLLALAILSIVAVLASPDDDDDLDGLL